MRLITWPIDPGYWCSLREHLQPGEPVVCAPLENLSVPPWWLDMLDIELDERDRGIGVRIGVIDSFFDNRSGLEHVEFIPVFQPMAENEPGLPHGEIVCRILADRAAPKSCAPICPGADIVVYFGGYSRGTWRLDWSGEGPSGDIDPVAVTNGIYELVLHHKVDVINLSLGTFEPVDDSSSGLKAAVEFAFARGVVLVAAAGNAHRNGVAFPARLPQCIGVGALGLCDWGPEGSAAHYNAQIGSVSEVGLFGARKIYLWCESAYGAGLDFLAPGVGIVVARHGKPAMDATGTSFAAPLNAGTFAINLSHIRQDRSGETPVSARHGLAEMLKTGSEYLRSATINGLFQGKGVMVAA